MNPRNLALIALLPLTACIVVTGPENEATASIELDEPISEIHFEQDAGDMDILVQEGQVGVSLSRTVHWRGSEPESLDRVEGETLVLGLDCGDNWNCWVDYTLIVPPGLSVRGETHAGDVVIDGPVAEVNVTSGAGDVEVSCASGPVFIETGAGDVVGSCIDASQLQVHSGAGDIELVLSGAPELAEVSTGAGDVDMTLPAGNYEIQVETGAGDVHIEGVDQTQGAQSVIIVNTGAGDVDIYGQ